MNDKFEKEFSIRHHCQALMRDAIAAHRNQVDNERFRSQEKDLGSIFYAEKRKLTLSFGRLMGHSTFIVKNAIPNDIVVVYNERMKNEWERYHSFPVITIGQIRGGRGYQGLDHPCDILWFDGSSVYEKLETAEYIGLCGYFQPVQIVVLGE